MVGDAPLHTGRLEGWDGGLTARIEDLGPAILAKSNVLLAAVTRGCRRAG